MPRRREVPERVIIPGWEIQDNKLVSKFIASIMRDGKKSTAESMLYGAFDIIRKKPGRSR
jgi:small subunit ribosomal protein S7